MSPFPKTIESCCLRRHLTFGVMLFFSTLGWNGSLLNAALLSVEATDTPEHCVLVTDSSLISVEQLFGVTSSASVGGADSNRPPLSEAPSSPLLFEQPFVGIEIPGSCGAGSGPTSSGPQPSSTVSISDGQSTDLPLLVLIGRLDKGVFLEIPPPSPDELLRPPQG